MTVHHDQRRNQREAQREAQRQDQGPSHSQQNQRPTHGERVKRVKNDQRSSHDHHTDTQEQQTKKSGAHPRRMDYSTHISDIRRATTIKYNQAFLLTNGAGDILLQDAGYGLYFRDMRYLEQFEMRLQDELGVPLLADASAGAEAAYEVTNPHLSLADGRTLAKERLSVRRVWSLNERLTHTIELRNMDQIDVAFDLTLRYASHFTDMFVIRGSQPGKRGELAPPQAHHDHVTLAYDGADDHTRTTNINFAPKPDTLDGQQATYNLKLKPGGTFTLKLAFTLEDAGPNGDDEKAGKRKSSKNTTNTSGASKHAAFAQELAQTPRIETSNALFDRALSRALADLRMLATANLDDLYLAAGVPWYVALLGRDSLITAFETLAYHPTLARSTLRLLAQYQGTKTDGFQDEEPGKILHELRVGEKANLHEVPMIPYYGTVDATPWFLMLLAEYVRWTGDLDLYKELHGNVERALDWIDANEADRHDIPGYLSYGSRSEHGLRNQGWKDSDNGIVNANGSLSEPPIALVEVQGYAYHARQAMAHLAEVTGDHRRAQQLQRKAEPLKKRFNDDFWLGGDSGYALCLQRDRKPSRAIASNPGQTLFTGITSADHAQKVADRLMQEDMFCGWGVRTLSANERAYNPLDYQTGSVWPHDNALIALGLRRWGFTEPMTRIFTGIFQAATQFPEFRLPEVFDGFSKDRYPRPVHYPVACSPQAWAAGALPLLLQTALGLEPDALNGVLRIHRPRLPEWLNVVTCRGLRVGDSTIDLEYRCEDDTTLVAVLGRQGDIDVVVEY
ncbi:MAG TPA: glycogen debranching N-terminal domain-containing protein [Ktedonobacterales bacterium]|nr:glycogen debranching N-terminal domain-containing protein [Ktedonobacterales bacterium]